MKLQAYLQVPLQAQADDRTIAGIAVPFGQTGYTSAGPVVFAEGSIPVDANPPLLLHHDLARPAGVVTELSATADAVLFRSKISEVPDGDQALLLVADGALTGVSVGMELTDYATDDDGVLQVTAAKWHELSLVTVPAFDAARIAAQAATETRSGPDQEATTMTDHTMTDDIADDRLVTAERAGGDIAPPTGAARTLPRTLPDLARIVASQARDAKSIRAALADVTTTQWPGRPSYLDELDEYILTGTPVTNAFLTRSIASDAQIMQRRWKTRPIPGVQTVQKTQIPTNAAEVEWVPVQPQTYAWGVDVSIQAIDQGGEAVLSDIARAGTEEIAELIESDFVALLEASATVSSVTTGVDFAAIGVAIGELGKYNADTIIAAPDVYGSLWVEMGGGGPAKDRIDGLTAMPMLIKSTDMTAGTAIVCDRRAARTSWSGTPRLRAVEVSLLGVNLGVYRYCVQEVRYPEGLIKINPETPPVAAATRSKAKA